MTCLEIYDVALRYIFEKSKTEYQNFYIPFLNLISAECFALNNFIRQSKGLEELTEIPQYALDEDVVVYEEELTKEVLPLGLASHIAKEDEQEIYNVYIQMYEVAKARLISQSKVILKEIERVY